MTSYVQVIRGITSLSLCVPIKYKLTLSHIYKLFLYYKLYYKIYIINYIYIIYIDLTYHFPVIGQPDLYHIELCSREQNKQVTSYITIIYNL